MAFFCYALPAQADQLAEANDSVLNDSVLIDGDKLELHLERNMRATGHASMRRGQQSVSGDVIDYDLQNDELHVTGNVAITLDNAKIEGSELRLQLSSQLGEFKNARFSMLPRATAQPAPLNSARIAAEQATLMSNNSSPLDLPSKPISSATDVLGSLYLSTTFSAKKLTSQGRGDAKSVIFEGQDVKRFKEARYTTCAAGVDDWYIKADELKLNNYSESGSAKNAYLEVMGKTCPIIGTFHPIKTPP
jgi:LPS-assembly protein